MLKLVLISIPTLYVSGNPSSHPSSLAYLFKFYVGHFKKLLKFFSGLHAVSHDVLSYYRSIRSMYIEETLHRKDSVSLSVAIGV